MARAVALPTLGLSPFGGGGSSFDAFSIGAAKTEKAYLAFRKVEIEWEAGRTTNAAYLAALQLYANSLKANSSERVSAQARVEQYTYRFERAAIELGVKNGTKTKDELLAFDLAGLNGINQDSEEYLSRLAQVNSVQNDIFNEEQDKKQEEWSDGRITTAQLLEWYRSLRPDLLAGNNDLADNVAKALDDLADRAIDERDNKFLTDYSEGKIAPTDFLAYATTAQGRYKVGTSQYDDWTNRIEDAKDRSIEDSILYRYDLSQRYMQLQKFVKDNGTAPKGGTSTSSSSRVVWNGKKWVTVTTTSSKSSGPTKIQQQAWKELQIEVADAKKEMAEIAKKAGAQAGGWVTTDNMIAYYKRVQSRYAVGTTEWYNVASKLDGLNSQKHAEAVLAKQGIKITYPKSGAGSTSGTSGTGTGTSAGTGTAAKPKAGSSSGASGSASGTSQASGDPTLTLEQFMKGVAKTESGGRYDARNNESGAYGKYQIIPSSWHGWAEKWLGDPHAKQTPENQEIVAKKQMTAMYAKLGDWRAVAHAWFSGDYTKDPAKWSSASSRYVNKVFGALGMSPTRVVAVTPKVKTPTSTGGATPASGKAVPAKGKTITIVGPKDTRKNPLNFPKGYGGDVYENFYAAYMDAWRSGEETFIDYSSGKAVAYFVPTDVETRLDLAQELDARRVDYYIAKSAMYLNKSGHPTSASESASDQANRALVDAVENVAFGLTFAQKPGTMTPAPKGAQSPSVEARNFQTYELGTDESGQPYSSSSTGVEASLRNFSTAAATSNALAKGIELANKLDIQTAQLAAAAKKAYDSGDFNLAYGLTQKAVDLVGGARETLAGYLAGGQALVDTIRRLGGTTPGTVTKDMNELQGQINQLGTAGTTQSQILTGNKAGADPALKVLDEVSNNLQRILNLDSDGEPRRAPDGELILGPNVTLIWKNGKIDIDETSPQGVGYSSPTKSNTGKPTVQMGGVKVGSGIKGNVQAEYTTGIVGFVGGNENYPVYGKIVAGVDATGKSFQWAEDPIFGGWYDITRQPLTVTVPTGFTAAATGSATSASGLAKTPTGTQMDYQFKIGNDDARLVWDPTDGKYVVMTKSGNALTGGDWTPIGKVGGPDSKNSDLAAMLKGAKWGIDMTDRRGSDHTFSNQMGPIIGIGSLEWTAITAASAGGRALLASRQLAPAGPSLVGDFGRAHNLLGPKSGSRQEDGGYLRQAQTMTTQQAAAATVARAANISRYTKADTAADYRSQLSQPKLGPPLPAAAKKVVVRKKVAAPPRRPTPKPKVAPKPAVRPKVVYGKATGSIAALSKLA